MAVRNIAYKDIIQKTTKKICNEEKYFNIYIQQHEGKSIIVQRNKNIDQTYCLRGDMAHDVRKALEIILNNNLGVPEEYFRIENWKEEEQIKLLEVVYAIRYEKSKLLQHCSQDKFFIPNRNIYSELKKGRLENDVINYIEYLYEKYYGEELVLNHIIEAYEDALGANLQEAIKKKDIDKIAGLFSMYAVECLRNKFSILDYLMFLCRVLQVESSMVNVLNIEEEVRMLEKLEDNIVELNLFMLKHMKKVVGILEAYLLAVFFHTILVENNVEADILAGLILERKEKKMESYTEKHGKICCRAIEWMQKHHYLDEEVDISDSCFQKILIDEIWRDKNKYCGRAAYEVAMDLVSDKYILYGDFS